MNFENEKDYIMRIIHEVIKLLISLVLGKNANQAEPSPEMKYDLSDSQCNRIRAMVDRGEMNEAENMLLDKLDCVVKSSIAELIFFYEYTSQQSDEFLEQHNYPKEEVLEGLRMLAAKTGFQHMVDLIDES